MMTFRQLCQSLADSERAMAKRKGSESNQWLQGVLKGRAEQLKYMKNNFPDKYPTYIEALDDRIRKPYDFKAILASIPSE